MLYVCVTSVSTSRCVEERERGLLDCVDTHLQNVYPMVDAGPMIWVESIDAAINNISSVNFAFLLANFPNLAVINLRWNPFDCVIPKELPIKVSSDCPFVPTPYPTPDPTSHPTLRPTPLPTAPPPTAPPPTSSSTISTNNKKSMIVSLTVSFGVLSVVLLLGVMYFLRWRKHRVNILEQYELSTLSLSSSSSDEIIIFDEFV